MPNEKVLKIAGFVCSAVGIVINALTVEQSNKKMEQRIQEKVRQEVLQDVMDAMKKGEAI